MVRSALSKVAWVGRTASMVFGLAPVMALLLGVATMAFGANGDFFKVGRANVASAVSTLDKSGAGPALRLLVDSGPPMAVNSAARVPNLNADRVDGRGFACPRGTLLHEAVCIDVARRAASATLITAERDCLDEGKRLPTVAELQTFRIRGDTTLPANPRPSGLRPEISSARRPGRRWSTQTAGTSVGATFPTPISTVA